MFRNWMTRNVCNSLASTTEHRHTRRVSPPPSVAFRPRVEALEAREVPSADVWTNTSGDKNFDNPANWSLSAVPVAGDDIYFNGAVSIADCNDMHGAGAGFGGGDDPNPIGDEYHSVNFINSYSGTVTLSAGFSTAILVLTSGAIKQPATGTDITVSGSDSNVPISFTWTGGILNSSSFTSTVTIQGNGSITPAGGGTVQTGSTLQLLGPPTGPAKTTTVAPGTIQFNNAAGAVIGAFAILKSQTVVSGDVIGFQTAGATSWTIQSGGRVEYIGPGTINNGLQVTNSGGVFKVSGQAAVSLTGGNATTPDYTQTGTSDLILENGSSLTVTHILKIQAGIVHIEMNPNLAAGQQNATIIGVFDMSGGMIVFGAPITIGTALVYGTFTVTGDVFWSGGRYKPNVDYTTAGLANKWIVNGTMNTATGCIVEANPQNGQNPPPSSAWEVMNANATNGPIPTTPPGSPLTLGLFDEGGVKKWKLTSPQN